MNTIIKKTDISNIDMSVIDLAAQILKDGGLVAFPTETVYGLGADGLNENAAAKIYAAKGRPSDNPLILHIADEKELERLVKNVPDVAKKLMDAFWPGPLTLIFEKSDTVPKGTTGGLSTVAVRMPEHPVARKLIQASQISIAAPSANISGKPSPTSGQHVIDDMNGKVDMIIDGGEVGIGLESTIVDVTCTPPMILRPGFITKEMLEDETGEVAVDRAVLEKPDKDLKPKAPGMKYRHYAPAADFVIFSGKKENVINAIVHNTICSVEAGEKVGIIATDENIGIIRNKTSHIKDKVIIVSIGTEKDMETIAGNLYKVLRNFDKTDVGQIYGETFANKNLGQAVMNRMCKAAGYNIVRV